MKLRHGRSNGPSHVPQWGHKDSIKHRPRGWRSHLLNHVKLQSWIVCLLLHIWSPSWSTWPVLPNSVGCISGPLAFWLLVWIWPVESTSRKPVRRWCVRAGCLLSPSLPRPQVPQPEATAPMEKPCPIATATPAVLSWLWKALLLLGSSGLTVVRVPEC